MPVMLVATADDPYHSGDAVRYSAGRLPTATVLLLESGGHILIGQDERVQREIRRFLAAEGIPPGRAANTKSIVDREGADSGQDVPVQVREAR